MPRQTRRLPTHHAMVLLLAGTALLAGACNTQTTSGFGEGIGFRQARYEEISAMRSWRQCRDDALALDRQARQENAPARYLASARMIEKCEADLGPEATGLAAEERMRAYALSIQNRLKGGDVAQARANLEAFRESFVDGDLYYPDGASFIETMEILLGLKDRTSIGEFSMANVSGELKSELRRTRYWLRN